jgi:hypothetical protein
MACLPRKLLSSCPPDRVLCRSYIYPTSRTIPSGPTCLPLFTRDGNRRHGSAGGPTSRSGSAYAAVIRFPTATSERHPSKPLLLQATLSDPYELAYHRILNGIILRDLGPMPWSQIEQLPGAWPSYHAADRMVGKILSWFRFHAKLVYPWP